MNLHVVTVVHGPAEMLAASMLRFGVTAGRHPDSITIVDNHWPLDKERNTKSIAVVAAALDARLLRPPDGNIGGHQGQNMGISSLNLADSDLVLLYDYDSWPITPGWLEAMTRAMADSVFDSLSLLHVDIERIHRERMTQWAVSSHGGVLVGQLPHPEMFNVTIFRGAWLKKHPIVGKGFYGHIESLMHSYNQHGYLMTYGEGSHPIPTMPTYSQWKRAHAGGEFTGNFDAWCQERGAPQ